MIACTLNSLVTIQDVSISNLWWEIHTQAMAGNSTFLWFLCLTIIVIASFTSCVLYSIKPNLVICSIPSSMFFHLGFLLQRRLSSSYNSVLLFIFCDQIVFWKYPVPIFKKITHHSAYAGPWSIFSYWC